MQAAAPLRPRLPDSVAGCQQAGGQEARLGASVCGQQPLPMKLGYAADEEAPVNSGCIHEAQDGVAEAIRKETWLRWTSICFFLVTAWWTAAVFIAIVFKKTLALFPYPFVITASTNLLISPIAWGLSRLTEKPPKEPAPAMELNETLSLLLIGCLQGVELGCNNTAVGLMPVSMKTMMHSMFVLFVMVAAALNGLESLCCYRAIAAALIIAGGVMQGLGAERRNESAADQSDHQHGAIFLLITMTLGAQRWALTQRVIKSESPTALGRLGKLEFMTRVLPVAGFICLGFAAAFEREAFEVARIRRDLPYFSIPIIGFCVVTLTICELSLVVRTSAVALQVMSSLHQIPIAVVSAIVLQEHIGSLSVVGFFMCVGAAFVYAYARLRAAPKDSAAEPAGASNPKYAPMTEVSKREEADGVEMADTTSTAATTPSLTSWKL
eukprot:TRINITY_DN10193_c0_g1_i1.p1 TRINITY_DN10193_c0_g1~~TRINITY_DN10193_c0_g1_i1.p1  ORF type:complete len:439 (-),score=87.64 TRINITY_DN10193_c0_g1_i1:178-1494(-)